MSIEALKLALEALKTFHYAMIDAGVLDRQEVLNQGFTAATAIKEALAQPEQEPVAWLGLDLDNMAEAFHRVIEEHHSRKYPFHDPVNRDAMIALRELRGLIAYMKRNTTPPQRKPLTDKQIGAILEEPSIAEKHQGHWLVLPYAYARAIEAAHGIKGEA